MKYLLILLLGTFAFVGCEKQDTTTTTPPAVETPTNTPPATP